MTKLSKHDLSLAALFIYLMTAEPLPFFVVTETNLLCILTSSCSCLPCRCSRHISLGRIPYSLYSYVFW